MGFTKTAMKGISWAWTLSLFLRATSFIKMIILARLLLPDQFGVYGIALLVLALLETITETGVNVFLIQEKEKLETYLDSAWIVSILRGIVIFLVMNLSSNYIASFFHSSNAVYILILFSFVPLIRGFINPSEVKFQKEVNFDKEFAYRSCLSLVDTIVSIVVVFYTHQIAGLAVGAIVGVIMQVILSFALISPKPKINIQKSYLAKIFHRGKWVTLSGIFNYLFHNADNIVVGRLLGSGNLGLYQMAYNISMLPITDVTNVISKVTFPVYSQISNDRQRLRKAFIKTIFFICLVTIPFGVILFLNAPQLVGFFLGSKWMGIVWVLKILAIFGTLQAIVGFPATVFLSVGKQNYVSVMVFVSLVTLIVTIFPLIQIYGIVGAGIAALLGSISQIPFTAYFVYRIFKDK